VRCVFNRFDFANHTLTCLMMNCPILLRLLACLVPFASALPARADWTNYQANAAHTGYVPGSVNLNSAKLLWQKSLPYFGMGIGVGAGTVFATEATRSGNITRVLHATALDAASGNVLWQKEYPGYRSLTGPTYYNGVVYFQASESSSPNDYLQAFNARSGAPIFQAEYPSQHLRYLIRIPV
jgi:outer membrane protein assembly factor BamB